MVEIKFQCLFFMDEIFYFCTLKHQFPPKCLPGTADIQVLPGFSLVLGVFYKRDVRVQGKKKELLKIKSVVSSFKHTPESHTKVKHSWL
jgi:hypothetical protein